MTAVSDTSPICYLILIDKISLVPRLFNVLVPQAVLAELRHEDAPEVVRKWSFNLPSWIAVKDDSVAATTGMENLQAGERAAILLAQSVNANVILLDEKSARRVAARSGLAGNRNTRHIGRSRSATTHRPARCDRTTQDHELSILAGFT